MKRSLKSIVLLLVAGSLCLAAAPQAQAPRSLLARQALAKFDQAKQQAEAAYKRAMTDAGQKLIIALDAAKQQAMRSGDLREANAINSAIIQAKAELDHAGHGQARTFTIYANKDWQPTIMVRKGQHVEIKASGTWCFNRGYAWAKCGPDGMIDPHLNQLLYYLQARLGDDGKSRKIGSSLSFVADADGVLQLRMYDSVHQDNAGQIDVSILANQ